MSTSGHIEVVDVNGIEYGDDGTSLRLEVTETIPPHRTCFVVFEGVCVSKLFQVCRDEFPLTIIDLTWHAVAECDKAEVLTEHSYPFLSENGRLRIPEASLVAAHLEGDLVGDIVAEKVLVENT